MYAITVHLDCEVKANSGNIKILKMLNICAEDSFIMLLLSLLSEYFYGNSLSLLVLLITSLDTYR